MATQDDVLKSNKHILKDHFIEEQISRFGSRYKEYRQQYEAAGRFELEPSFPLYIMLEQTYKCNLHCPMCIQGLPTERKSFQMDTSQMSMDLFKKIVLEGEKYHCPSISMHVNDEPLLVRDLPERIRFAKEHGFMDIIMTSNGVLFTEEKVKQVIDAGITYILFSIDGATQETYDKVRLGGNFDKVLKSIQMVREYRASKKSAIPLLRASFVQNRLNQHETEAFFEKFSPLVDFVEVQGFSHYYNHTDSLIPEGAQKIKEFFCNEPWRKLIVRANGDILPCCTFYGYDIKVGNLEKASLHETFNSSFMKKLRQDFKNGIYRNPACATCSKSYYDPVVTKVLTKS
jgi:radical SAM protein with 4Fe4S-binding SPASM domain